MEQIRTHKRWIVGAGAAALLLTGGLAAGPIASLAQGDPAAKLTEDEAAQAAIGAYPGTTSTSVELEEEDGRSVYEVTLSNGYEVDVDGNSGAILETEASDDDGASDDDAGDRDDHEDDEDRSEAGTLDDGADLLPRATITLDQAIAAAQDAADGAAGEVDLEYVGDRLVFNVDIGDKDVKIDAADGSVVAVDSDD